MISRRNRSRFNEKCLPEIQGRDSPLVLLHLSEKGRGGRDFYCYFDCIPIERVTEPDVFCLI